MGNDQTGRKLNQKEVTRKEVEEISSHVKNEEESKEHEEEQAKYAIEIKREFAGKGWNGWSTQ